MVGTAAPYERLASSGVAGRLVGLAALGRTLQIRRPYKGCPLNADRSPSRNCRFRAGDGIVELSLRWRREHSDWSVGAGGGMVACRMSV